LTGLILLSSCNLLAAQKLKVTVPPIGKAADMPLSYFYQILELALQKTVAGHGPYEIAVYPTGMSTDRAVLELKAGQSIDVIFIVPDKRKMLELQAIPISLLNELNSFRILLIREGTQAQFDQVNTLADLRKFRVGMGGQWPGTKILRSNGFHVEAALKNESLFKMLAARRFDFIPRGIYEVQDDYVTHKDQGLAMETRLLLYYKAPFYFFVNKNRPALAARIEAGLMAAQADGSFDRLLMSFPAYKAATKVQLSSGRKILQLNEPALVD